MCKTKVLGINEASDSSTESSDSDIEISEAENEAAEDVEEEEEEEEDEVIKAIKRECERKNDHPPVINCEDFITDISFHPSSDILAVASIGGDVLFYKYSTEENNLQSKWGIPVRCWSNQGL